MNHFRVSVLFSFRVMLFSLLLLPLSGCARQSQQPSPADVEMTLAVTPEPAVVGPATLSVTLTDAAGEPVEDAQLNIRGDMSHAGMEPVLAEVEGGVGGVYEVPFNWTMGGDWFVVVEATLADGRTLSRRFDVGVAGDMDMGE